MTVVALAAVVCAVAAPFAQQPGISALVRTEIVRIAPPPDSPAPATPNAPPNVADMMAQMADLFAKTVVPEGKADVLWMGRAGAARSEFRNPMLMIPAGSVMITRSSGVTVLNPAERTYYDVPMAPGMGVPNLPPGVANVKPEVTVTPTGQTDNLLGHPVERVDITVRVPFPARPDMHAPPGMPTEITMTMESWETSDFGNAIDAGLTASLQGMLASTGMDKVMRPGRFPLKFVGRLSLLPGYEIRTTVLEISQKPLAAELFEVPADFKKVSPPHGKPV